MPAKKLTAVVTAAALAINLTSFAFCEQLSYDPSCESAELDISAQAAVLIEANTGTVLFAKNEKEHRSIASTTKIMTALLTLEAGELDEKFTVDPVAIMVEGTSMGLREGDIVTRRALCYGMLLPSGNDAANAAAVSVSGTMTAFAERMNQKAAALGMENSNFVTPSGLDANNQYSCAYDLALLTADAMENEDFREICSQSKASVEFGNPPYKKWLTNSNKMLYSYPDCIGVKTGFTDNAGRTLVTAAQRGGVTLIAVTLDAPDDWQDHTEMLDYGFSAVTAREAQYDCSAVRIPVIGGEQEDIGVQLSGSAILPLTSSQEELVEVSVHLPHFLYAGINAGDVIGEARFILNGRIVARCEIIAGETCKAKDQRLSLFAEIIKLLRNILPL